MLRGKHILIGVTGGIAAYKAAILVRLLVKQGAEVQVVMSPCAGQFVTQETLSVLSGKKVLVEFFGKENTWNNHVHLAHWADLLLIAPCTANTLSKMVSGQCDNLLMAVYLSSKCRVMLAPAMDEDMFHHFSTRENLKKLKVEDHLIIPSGTGELASGIIGEGRMAEPEEIVEQVKKQFETKGRLKGKRVLVTGGPTWEEIDPVRYLGNRSSGKMGIALANAFTEEGAEVTLVLGPTHLGPGAGVNCIRVESSAEMFEHCTSLFKNSNIVVMSAAVADYKAEEYSYTKIKKKKGSLSLKLRHTTDILAELGKLKKKQCLVGFALESKNLLEYAKNKIKQKNLDFIVANTLEDEGAGFAHDTNKILIVDKRGKVYRYPLKSKVELAKDIVNFTLKFIKSK